MEARPPIVPVCPIAKHSPLKRIASATLMDCVGLFDRPIRSRRGYMITINSCSDHDADATCKKVVRYAAKLNRSFLLAIEPLQWRGNVPIVRPHAHLLVDVTKSAAQRIASYFQCRGADVDVTFLYEPRGALWYVGMTDGSIHYFNRRKEPPPPSEEEEAGDSVAPERDVQGPRACRTRGWWHILWAGRTVMTRAP